MKKIGVSDLKARCLAVVDEVSKTGEQFLVTKRGKIVARLVPAVTDSEGYPQDNMRGSLQVCGDIISPAIPEADWDVFNDALPLGYQPRQKKKSKR